MSKQGNFGIHFRTEEDTRRILKAYRAKEQPEPFHRTFPETNMGEVNARRRLKNKIIFNGIVKTICGAERRKVWRQLKKDYYEFQQHLKVA